MGSSNRSPGGVVPQPAWNRDWDIVRRCIEQSPLRHAGAGLVIAWLWPLGLGTTGLLPAVPSAGAGALLYVFLLIELCGFGLLAAGLARGLDQWLRGRLWDGARWVRRTAALLTATSVAFGLLVGGWIVAI